MCSRVSTWYMSNVGKADWYNAQFIHFGYCCFLSDSRWWCVVGMVTPMTDPVLKISHVCSRTCWLEMWWVQFISHISAYQCSRVWYVTCVLQWEGGWDEIWHLWHKSEESGIVEAISHTHYDLQNDSLSLWEREIPMQVTRKLITPCTYIVKFQDVCCLSPNMFWTYTIYFYTLLYTQIC